MRRLRIVWASLAVGLLASVASAGVLNTHQTLTLRLTNLGQAGVSDSALLSVDATSPPLDEIRMSTVSPLSLNTVLPVTDPQVSCGGIAEIRLTSIRPRIDLQGGVFGNLQSAIASSQSALSPATMPLTGSFRICLLLTGCTGSNFVFPLGEETPGNGFVGAGVGGLLTVGGAAGTIRISVQGAPWTVNTVTAFNRTSQGPLLPVQNQGFAHGPASVTGTTTLTSGVLQLVTANQIHGNIAQLTDSGVFHHLVIHFVPEPSRALLWLAGAGALLMLGRARGR